MLNEAPYGAYAVDMRQIILFWNRSAEQILGHRADQVIGQRCYQVLQNICGDASAPYCIEGCPSLRLAKEGRNPPVVDFLTLCASGWRKPLTVTPLVVPDANARRTLLLYLLHEKTYEGHAKGLAGVVRSIRTRSNPSTSPIGVDASVEPIETGSLTVRELEVVRLMSMGLRSREIAGELNVSLHTVLNHIRHARQKLRARTRLEVVLAAQRLGLL